MRNLCHQLFQLFFLVMQVPAFDLFPGAMKQDWDAVVAILQNEGEEVLRLRGHESID